MQKSVCYGLCDGTLAGEGVKIMWGREGYFIVMLFLKQLVASPVAVGHLDSTPPQKTKRIRKEERG